MSILREFGPAPVQVALAMQLHAVAGLNRSPCHIAMLGSPGQDASGRRALTVVPAHRPDVPIMHLLQFSAAMWSPLGAGTRN